MSAAGEAKDKKDTLASGAEPRHGGRVREQGWRPTNERSQIAGPRTEAARRRAIARARLSTARSPQKRSEGA